MKRGAAVGAVVVLSGAVALTVWWRGHGAAPRGDERGQSLSAGPAATLRDVAAKDVEDLVTPEGFAIVRNADRVEFFKQRVELPHVDHWEIERRRPGTLGELAEARDVLLSPAVYSWGRRGGHKRCGGFQPRDAVRFWRGSESTTFLICFTCSDVGVVYQDRSGAAGPWMIADSNPGKARLEALMAHVFPGAATQAD